MPEISSGSYLSELSSSHDYEDGSLIWSDITVNVYPINIIRRSTENVDQDEFM